jgi:simple sugar transport system substrate-binding protein
VGFVYVGPVGDFGWTYAHDQGRLQVEEHFGDAVETSFVENVAEGPDAERIIRQLAQDGNKLIFTTSFGFMNPTVRVAKQFPDVYFEHATGYQRTENLATYNARFYEGRAVLGTIAAMMSETGTAGYIASFPIPEVVMGINAFQLAAQKVNPDFKTQVVWVSTWYDPAKEADAARALLDQGADIITQHTDSPAALQVAEERGAYAFGQATDMSRFAPRAHLTAIEDNWGPYYIQRVQAVLDGAWETSDTWAGMKDGEVVMSEYRENVPAEVRAAAEAVEASIIDGSMHPFTGPILDQAGAERVAPGVTMTDAELAGMDWYVQGVQS